MFLPFSTTYHKEFLVGDIGSWREINNETPEILEIVRRSWELQRNDGIGMEIRRNHGVYKYMNWILCEKRNCKEIGMRRKEGCCNWYDTSSSKFTSLRNLSLYCVPRVFRKFPEDLVFFFFIRFLAYAWRPALGQTGQTFRFDYNWEFFVYTLLINFFIKILLNIIIYSILPIYS